MATFRVIVNYSYTAQFEIEANSYSEADDIAHDRVNDWLPTSADKTKTDIWPNADVEVMYLTGDLEGEEQQ